MKLLPVFLLFPFATFSQTIVTIQNPSFEKLPQATLSAGQCYNSYVARSGYPNEMPPGWVRTFRDPIWGSTSVIQPVAGNPCNKLGPQDGSWMLYVASSTVVQDTGIKPSSLQNPGVGEDVGVYLLKVWVANYFTVYPGYYEAAIIYGTVDPVAQIIKGHELCSIDGWATQHFNEIPLVCPAPGYLLGEWPDGTAVDPNAHIIVSLSHTQGWPLLFDNVSLTFTPSN